MRLSVAFAAALLSVALGGCSSPPPLDPARPLTVALAGDQALTLRNSSSRPIHYLVFEREFAARVLWGPCTAPDQGCPRIDAHGRAQVPYAEIGGYTPGAREAIVYWWHLVKRGSGWEVDEVRAIVVPL